MEEQLTTEQPSPREVQKTTIKVVLTLYLEKIYANANTYAEICDSYCKDIKGYREGVKPSDIRRIIGGIIYSLDKTSEVIKSSYGLKWKK